MMTEAAYSRALEAFEALPGVVTMRRSIAILSRAGIDDRRIRAWCRSVAESYGVSDEVGRNFESNVLAIGLTIARAAQLQAEG